MELREFGIRDMIQGVLKPFVRIDAVLLATSHEAIHHGRSLGCFVSPGKEVILSAQGQGADFVLDMIVVDEQTPILEQGCQGRPLILGISKGLANGALRGDIHAVLIQPVFKRAEQWQKMFFPVGLALLGCKSGCLALMPVYFLDVYFGRV